jgi:cytokinesis protein
MANLFLIHGVTTVVDELEIRVHLRSQMEACGLKKVLDKMKQFGHTSIDRLISQIESEAEDDAREIAREFNQDVLKDLGAPQDVFNALLSSVEGTRAHDFFLSSMQHLLLIREDDDTRIRYFQLIDQLISAVVLDQKGANGLDQDFSSLMGVSVNKVVNRFADQDRLDKALANAAEMKATAQQLALEKAAVEEELAQSGQGLVQKLQDKLAATEELLKGSRAATKKLELELEEMKKMYEERIASLELRIQELFNMLRESRELENVAAGSGGTIDRAEMIANLERQHELKKTIQTLEGRHRRAKNGLAEVNRGEGGAFEDGEESSDGMEAPEIALVEGKIPMSKAKGKVKSTKLRRDEVKSGSQFLDAEEERVREHIEQSLADGLDKLVRLSFLTSSVCLLRSSLPLLDPPVVELSWRHPSVSSRTRRPAPLESYPRSESAQPCATLSLPRRAQRPSILKIRLRSRTLRRQHGRIARRPRIGHA